MSDLSSLQNLRGSHWKSISTAGFWWQMSRPGNHWLFLALTGPAYAEFSTKRMEAQTHGFLVEDSVPFATSLHNHLQLVELVEPKEFWGHPSHRTSDSSAAQRIYNAASCFDVWGFRDAKSSTLLRNCKIIQVITKRMPQLMSPKTGVSMNPKKQILWTKQST